MTPRRTVYGVARSHFFRYSTPMLLIVNRTHIASASQYRLAALPRR